MAIEHKTSFLSRLRARLLKQPMSAAIPLILFAVNIFLMHSLFFPSFSDINPWDEASYLHQGMLLLETGQLPAFAANPLTSLFYALTYLPFRNSPLWMVLSCSLSRLFLFSLLWFAAYRVARELEDYAPVPVQMGFMFITTLTMRTMRFPSDPLFASLAGISFSYLLRYRNTSRAKYLGWASLWMGLAAMARNDGLILFLILVVLALLQAARFNQIRCAAVRILTPFLLLVGAYLGIYATRNGAVDFGTAARTYDAFEVGHLVIMGGLSEGEPVLQAPEAAREAFGTPEENNYNVFRAILRNPSVYFERLLAVIKKTPVEFLLAYSRLAYLIPLFAIRGLIEFIRRRQYLLAFIFCAWPAHLLTSFITTIVRPGHLIFPYYAAFAISAVGLWSLLQDLHLRQERWAWRAGLAAIVVFSLLDNHPSTGYVYALLWIMIETIILLQQINPASPPSLTLMILFCAGLLLRGSYPQPLIPHIGEEPGEQALMIAAASLEPGDLVASASPGFAWALKTDFIGLSSPDTPIRRTSDGFVEWLRSQHVGLVYVDTALRDVAPTAWELLQAQVGLQLSQIYSSTDGSIQLLSLIPVLEEN